MRRVSLPTQLVERVPSLKSTSPAQEPSCERANVAATTRSSLRFKRRCGPSRPHQRLQLARLPNARHPERGCRTISGRREQSSRPRGHQPNGGRLAPDPTNHHLTATSAVTCSARPSLRLGACGPLRASLVTAPVLHRPLSTRLLGELRPSRVRERPTHQLRTFSLSS
jgi:hypothetical protein